MIGPFRSLVMFCNPMGHFLQTDPIGYEDDLNLYAYVRNDPLNLADPTGRCPNCVSGGIGAGFGAIINGGMYALEANERGDFTWSGLLANAAEGAVIGGLIGFGAPPALVLGAGALGNVLEDGVTDVAAGRSLGDTPGQVAMNIGGDAAMGALEAGMGQQVVAPLGRVAAQGIVAIKRSVERPGMGFVRDQVMRQSGEVGQAAAGAAGASTAEGAITYAADAAHKALKNEDW